MSVDYRDVVIFGSGGLGREVLWTALSEKACVIDENGEKWEPRILGFVDDNQANHGATINEYPVIGGSDWLASNPGMLVLMAVGIPAIRRNLVERLATEGVKFASLVSPDSIVGDHSTVGVGSIILPGAVVSTNVKLGRFVLLNPTTSISHDGSIGDFTSLGPGVSLAGNVHVGETCDLGTNASAIPGMSIGSNTIVGAGACVVRDLPANVTAVGVPAKVIGERGL